MLRRIAGWVVLVPLSVVLIVFALANRQLVVVNFNPLVSPDGLTSPGVGVPLFLVIFAFLLLGVVLGGIAGWFAQSRVRRDRRRWQREADRLGRELDALRRPATAARRGATPLDIDDLVDT
ncbi:MAG: LapA family protein [Devosia sp.]|nr:LapA family protein [Devosia sp.]